MFEIFFFIANQIFFFSCIGLSLNLNEIFFKKLKIIVLTAFISIIIGNYSIILLISLVLSRFKFKTSRVAY